MEAYNLAVDQGADVIECDLAVTKVRFDLRFINLDFNSFMAHCYPTPFVMSNPSNSWAG